MQIRTMVFPLALVLLAAACPVNGDREVAPDTMAVVPPHDPAALASEAQTVPLAPAAGEQVSAEAVVLPVGVQTQVTVHVSRATPSTSLTAHVLSGSCDQPGPLAADLQPVVTDASGMGTSQVVIDIAPHVVVNGNHLVQLRRANGREGIPVACGEIAAYGDSGGVN